MASDVKRWVVDTRRPDNNVWKVNKFDSIKKANAFRYMMKGKGYIASKPRESIDWLVANSWSN